MKQRRVLTAMQRFCRFVRVLPTGCHKWVGGRGSNGYSMFWDNGRTGVGHRWIWEKWNGPIPESMTLDHLCRNRWCVNPGHFEVVTRYENVRRGNNHVPAFGRATHCVNGHEFSPANTYKRPTGGRACIACLRAHTRKWRAARRTITEVAS
jgi:hypothetical protein